MVQITEFRVVMPLSLEEYQISQMHMVMKMQQENTTGDEGVEILESKPFEDEEYGRGQCTTKLYHLHSKVPSWLTTFAPANSLIVEEKSWNAFPKCKTVLKCPYFTKFALTVETIHVADNGQLSNVHNLTAEKLALRNVENIDIASTTRDYRSFAIGGAVTNTSTFQSHRTGRGPLLAGWQETCDPVMTAYKLVTVDAPYWGFGSRLEQFCLAEERALFQESHRRCFSWIDEWYGLTLEDIRQLECKGNVALNMVFTRNKSTSNVEEEHLDEIQSQAGKSEHPQTSKPISTL